MRPNTMYTVLLLICALAVAATVTPCDRSLVKGVTLPDEESNLPFGRFVCANDNERIRFDSTAYYEITCSPSGWMGKREGVDSKRDRIELAPVKLAEADSPLSISCLPTCAANAGEGVDMWNQKRYGIETEIKTALCKDAVSFDLFFDNEKIIGNRIFCAPWEGWIMNSHKPKYYKVYSTDVLTQHQLECRKAPSPCSFNEVEGMSFNNVTNTLTCENGKTSLSTIELNSNRYSSLVCEVPESLRSTVWTSNGEYVAEASPKLAAICVEYCKSTGAQIKVNNGAIEVTCAESSSVLSFDGDKWSEVAKCSRNDGWTKSDGKTITKDVTATFQFECRKACTRRSDEGSKFDANGKLSKLTCKENASSMAKIKVDSKMYDSLVCDKANGWKDGDNKISDPHIPLDATCVEYCASSGNAAIVKQDRSIQAKCNEPDFGISFNSKWYKSLECNGKDGWKAKKWEKSFDLAGTTDPIQLTCKKFPTSCVEPQGTHYDNEKKLGCWSDPEKSIHRVEINFKSYAYLKCDTGNGWGGANKREDEDKNVEFVADSDAQLNVACVEYCKATGTGIEAKNMFSRANENRGGNRGLEYVEVSCPDPTLGELFHDGKRVGRDKAYCWMNQGWFNEGDEKIRDDTKTPLQFECRPEPTTTTTTEKTTTTAESITEKSVPNEEFDTQNSRGVASASIGGIVLLIVLMKQ